MTKKQLEQRIETLEKELGELKSQLLSLALRPPASYPVFISQPPPVYFQPMIVPTWQPLFDPYHPVITCGNIAGELQC
jgi:hypothetical protein